MDFFSIKLSSLPLDPSKHLAFATSCCKNVYICIYIAGSIAIFCSFWTWHLLASFDVLYWQWKDQRKKNPPTTKKPKSIFVHLFLIIHDFLDLFQISHHFFLFQVVSVSTQFMFIILHVKFCLPFSCVSI